MTVFDRKLSLAIDAIHDELNCLTGTRGIFAALRRLWLHLCLRRLERRIPHENN